MPQSAGRMVAVKPLTLWSLLLKKKMLDYITKMFNSISRTSDVDEMMPIPFPREVIVMRDLTIQTLFKFIEIIANLSSTVI